MASIFTSIRIDAPRQRVFDIFTDLRAAPQRINAIDSLEVLTEGPIGKGTRFVETRTMCGRPQTETMEIVGWSPPASYTVNLEACGSRYATTFDFREDDGGGGGMTIVDVTLTVTPLRLRGRLMSLVLVLMKNGFRGMFERDLADLKAALEGESEGVPEDARVPAQT